MDTSVFSDEGKLASLGQQPILLQDLDINSSPDYQQPRRDVLANLLAEDQEKDMMRDMATQFSGGNITQQSLDLVNLCIPLINARVVKAVEHRNSAPVVGLDDNANLVKLRPSKTFPDGLLARPQNCSGYSVWELIHAVAFDDNEKLASAYRRMAETAGYLNLDRLDKDQPISTPGERSIQEPVLYRLAYGEKRDYVGQTSNASRRKEEHRRKADDKEGVNTMVADLNIKGIPYKFEVFHRFRLGTTELQRLALETSVIACAGTSLDMIPGRRGRGLQFNSISAVFTGRLNRGFTIWPVRAAYLRYLVLSYSECQAKRSTMPAKIGTSTNPEAMERFERSWRSILGPEIVALLQDADCSVKEFVNDVLFSRTTLTIRDYLDITYGIPDRISTPSRMSSCAGKMKGTDKNVTRAAREVQSARNEEGGIDCQEATQLLPQFWSWTSGSQLHSKERIMSDAELQEQIRKWTKIHELRSIPATRSWEQAKWSAIDVNKIQSTSPTFRPAAPSRSESSPAAVDPGILEFNREISVTEEVRQMALTDRSVRKRYIISVAKRLYLDNPRRAQSGYGRRIALDPNRGSSDKLGLLEFLNLPGQHFTLDEVKEAIDESQVFIRIGYLIEKIHPAEHARELEVRLQACRTAAAEHGIGDEASDSFIVYLAHGINSRFMHWLWPPTKDHRGQGVVNLQFRYDPTAAPPSIADLEAAVEDALMPWGCDKDDIRGAIHHSDSTWKGVLAGILVDRFPAADIWGCNLSHLLKQKSTRYPAWDFKKHEGQEFKRRCDATRQKRESENQARIRELELASDVVPTLEDCSQFMRSRLANLAIQIWEVSRESFMAWLNFPNHRSNKGIFRDPKRVLLRVLLRLFQGACPAYNLKHRTDVETAFLTENLFDHVDRMRLPLGFVRWPADRSVLESCLDEVAQRRGGEPWPVLNACNTQDKRASRRDSILRSQGVFDELYIAYCLKQNAIAHPNGNLERANFRRAAMRYLEWRVSIPLDATEAPGMNRWQGSELVTLAEIWRYFGDVPEAFEIACRAMRKTPSAFFTLSRTRADIFHEPTMARAMDGTEIDIRGQADKEAGTRNGGQSDIREQADEIGQWQDDDDAESYSGGSDVIGEWQE